MQAFFGLVALLGFAIILYPFFPILSYNLRPPSKPVYPYASRLEQLPDPANSNGTFQELPQSSDKPKPEGNRLVIPKIGVDIPIVEGSNEHALLRGAWRIPGTSDDPAKSNMVLSAHRFQYRPPSSRTFYLLDKLAPGDVFIVYWNDTEYDYRITDRKVVSPSAVEILSASAEPTMTLFTCTPLFSTAKRLVVVGSPI